MAWHRAHHGGFGLLVVARQGGAGTVGRRLRCGDQDCLQDRLKRASAKVLFERRGDGLSCLHKAGRVARFNFATHGRALAQAGCRLCRLRHLRTSRADFGGDGAETGGAQILFDYGAVMLATGRS